ncbi:MAG: hypothetical protein Q9180_008264 [Flavoplaca navasiana]
MADPNPTRPSREDPTLYRPSPSADDPPTDAASRPTRPSIPLQPSTISTQPNAAASPRINNTKDVSTQATDTGTRPLSDPPQKILYIENIQAKLSSIDSQMQKQTACQRKIQNQQCEIQKDILALKELKGLEIIRRSKSGGEDQEGLQEKGIEQTDTNSAIPHPAPPHHLTQLDKDHKAIDAYLSKCNIPGCHVGDAAGLVTAYLEARDDGTLGEDQLAILAIQMSKMLQREKRGGIWATVIELWLGDCKSQAGAVIDEVLDKYVVDAVRNMLDDKERLRAIRVNEKPSGHFEEALRGYGEQMRKRKE